MIRKVFIVIAITIQCFSKSTAMPAKDLLENTLSEPTKNSEDFEEKGLSKEVKFTNDSSLLPGENSSEGIASKRKALDKNSKNFCDDKYSCCTPSLYNPHIYNSKKKEFLIKADFLYWEGKLCGLEGAFGNTSVVIDNNTPGIETTTLTEVDRNPDFKWRPGFKIGTEFLVNCFNFDLYWTYFHGRATYSDNAQHGNWKLKYNTVDLVSGYNFYPCSRFLVKPFIGVRIAKIHQTLNSHLETLTSRPAEASVLVTSDQNDREKFWGVGPQVGVEADWYLGKDFSLYVMFDIITYYGRIKRKYNNVDSFTATRNISNWNKIKCFNCLGTDGAIGFRFDKYKKYCKCDIHFMLKLGVEQHRIYDFSELGSDGVLNIAGGVFEGSIGFLF